MESSSSKSLAKFINVSSFLKFPTQLTSTSFHPIISMQCTITSSFKLPIQPTLNPPHPSLQSKLPSPPLRPTPQSSLPLPLLPHFLYLLLVSTLHPTTTSMFNSLLQCSNLSLHTRLSPSTCLSSISQSSGFFPVIYSC